VEATAEAGPAVTPTEVAPEPAAEAAPQPVVVEELPQAPPVELPESWVAAATAAGFNLSNSADITEEVMGAIVGFAPQLLADLEPPMWRALDPAAAAIALAQVGQELDPALLAQLQALQLASSGVAPEPLPLPDSWVAAAAGFGITLETTADIPAAAMSQLGSFAPQLLQELSPEILLALAPEALAALPADYVEGLEEGLRQTVENIAVLHERYLAVSATPEQIAEAPEEDPARLPELLIQGAKAAGLDIEFAQELSPDLVRTMASFGAQGVQFLSMLTPDHLRIMPAESIALLPQELLEALEPDLLSELDELAAEFGGAGQLALEEAAAADPVRLPEVLIAGARSFGMEIEFAQDITPEFIRPLAAAGPQAAQLFSLLTEDHLRLLQPEVIALLPQELLESLDPDLRTELDELAAEFGGAGQLAIAEAEAAAAASAGSPPLSGAWLEPGADGTPSMFQTAGDLLNNPFVDGAAALLNFIPNSPQTDDPAQWMSALTPEVMAYLAGNEDGFVANLSPVILELMSAETLTFLLDSYPQAFDDELTSRLRGIAAGSITAFVPEASITRTDGNPSLIINLFKDGDANTVEVAHRIFNLLEAYKAENPDVTTDLVFEQATFIEDSIQGVAREGALGAVFAVVVILLFLSGHVGGKYKLSWRATLVTGTSIPLSVLAAFLLMRWVPPTVGTWLNGLVESSGNDLLTFFSRLFPTSVTLNIMTLSGLTVAIGRVVDDSIVVLENSYRYIQRGQDPKSAVLAGTKEVAIAIFSATATTVAVFMPLGLIGGIIGSFFLPFGLTVTYALAASFVVSITVVPALTYLLIRREHIPEEKETTMQRWYTPILRWAIDHRFYTMAIAAVIFLASLFLMGQLPQSFIPSIGEPTINVSVELLPGTLMAETDALVSELESTVTSLPGVETVQTEIGGGGGFESFFGGGGVSQNMANLTISVHEPDDLASLTNEIRAEAETLLGSDNVLVSAASQTGFGGFSMTLTGDSIEQLRGVVDEVKTAISSVDLEGDGIADIANVSSNVDNGDGLGGEDTIIRIDGRPAISFSGELETSNTLGVTTQAKQAIIDLGLPAGMEVTEGFESEQQVQGFRSMVVAIGYSVAIVYLIMALTFRSLIHPFTILFSLPFALVGAALALFISNSVLGISAMIGLMMLVGIVVTNGIVLMELVQQLRRRGSDAREALMRGGRTRLRPIWMTALAAVLALIPLGLSQEAGAIIASELALVVMGGLLVSTALTLVVVPVVYSLFDDLGGLLRRGRAS
jgi:HAE1 family hydrophobic/amphiphilic exporter-1